MKQPFFYRLLLIFSVVTFGTISLVVKPLGAQGIDSAMIAFSRAALGAAFLFLVHMLRGERFHAETIKRGLPLLALSGVIMAANWILLFESYRFTTVTVATVCYYMAPVFILLASPFLLGERMNAKKILCIALAVAGMVMVSVRPGEGTGNLLGVFLALLAALFYATVILINKRLPDISANDRTLIQLTVAAVAVLPYVLLRGAFALPTGLLPIAALLLLGIFHTGIAYTAYFNSVANVPTQTVALFSYLDPVVAVILSMTVLGEAPTVLSIVGVLLVIGASIWSELPAKGKAPQGNAPSEEE